MSATMRAKVQCSIVTQFASGQEQVVFNAVAAKTYDASGDDEDNTYAKFSPCATFTITITNPALAGQFQPGERYYVDFTPVPEQPA